MTTILRIAEVLRRTGLCKSAIYHRIKVGDFPRSVPLGGNTLSNGKVVRTKARGWPEHEVDAWVEANILARDTEVRGKTRPGVVEAYYR